MNNLFRGLISGYGELKLGGGCFGTIVVFLLSGFYLVSAVKIYKA
jgi:hypothetical protein